MGFINPESVAEGPDGSIYVSEIGKRDKDKDGAFKSGIDIALLSTSPFFLNPKLFSECMKCP